MLDLDHKEGWAPKNWCFWTVLLEKTLESPLDCKIKPVKPKWNQHWMFIGRTDAETEVPILWPPDLKSQLIGKNPDAGKIEGKRRRRWQRMEMVRWHHQLNGHEFEHTLGDSRGQRSLPCYCQWVTRNQTQLSNWTTTTLRPVIVSPHWYLSRSDPPTPFMLRNIYAIAETIVFTSCKPIDYSRMSSLRREW